MKIVFLSHSPSDVNGGASRLYHLLEQGLGSRGHSVQTLHCEDFHLPRQRTVARAIEKFAMPHWIGWDQRGRDFADVDVVMSPSGMGYRLFRRLRASPTRPLLVNQPHGLNLFDHQARLTEALAGRMAFPIHKRASEWLPIMWDFRGVREADLTVLQNRRDVDHLQRIGRSAANLAMIPPALHPLIQVASASATPAEARDPRRMVWFGSWVARKGAAVLPHAFDRVLDAIPDATLTIGGTGLPAPNVLSRFSARARARVRVLPRLSLPDQIAELQRHAVFPFPSLSEGFGLAVIEAMALGLVAVTTATGVGGDFLRHGETGLIVPPASALHLADSIIEAMHDNDARIAMTRRGQELARGFTLERMVTGYETAFADALARLRATQRSAVLGGHGREIAVQPAFQRPPVVANVKQAEAHQAQ